MAAKTLTPKEIALEWGVSAKTLRKFLRGDKDHLAAKAPGKGGRWAIEARSLASAKKRFDAWMIAQAEERAKRLADAASAETEEVEEESDTDAETDATDAVEEEVTEAE